MTSPSPPFNSALKLAIKRQTANRPEKIIARGNSQSLRQVYPYAKRLPEAR